MSAQTFRVDAAQNGLTVAGFLRAHLPALSWGQIRRLIENRRAKINDELCLDAARRLKAGDAVELLSAPVPRPRQQQAVNIRYLDAHLVVVEKPAGISTVRHPSERDWDSRRKALSPTLEDIVPRLITALKDGAHKGRPQHLRIVQRLDKETSGLLVFARTVAAEQGLGRQFHAHTVIRRYLAVVPGFVPEQRVASFLVRDRADGRRGSTTVPGLGKEAITHVQSEEQLPGYTLLSCRLETGRTHQIRIHLAELGHPVCGEKVYNRQPGGEPIADESGAPRLALHAAELGFIHPVSGAEMHWTMPLPADLQQFIDRLRGQGTTTLTTKPALTTTASKQAKSAGGDVRLNKHRRQARRRRAD
ncbi:MAG TPA: RluA family pseudouridine synthase [Gemmataceae bacterium]|jgi:23S rRNA pseudouridine1911/1915/1917 synthase|nr:RluA family pseudouridine synthase [Gemmataceae bacterium]